MPCPPNERPEADHRYSSGRRLAIRFRAIDEETAEPTEESMTRFPTARLGALPLIAALAFASPAAAQHEHGAGHTMSMPERGIRAELIRDIEQLERKYVALAEALAGRFDWRPGAGVRSVGEVFGHVAGANFTLPALVGHDAPESMGGADTQRAQASAQALEKEADEAKLRAELAHSFMHMKHSIAMVPDAELDAMTRMFGRDVTKREVLVTLVAHMHEHLGQAIAYARMNDVTPPWSGGGN